MDYARLWMQSKFSASLLELSGAPALGMASSSKASSKASAKASAKQVPNRKQKIKKVPAKKVPAKKASRTKKPQEVELAQEVEPQVIEPTSALAVKAREAPDGNGWTALHRACKNGDPAFVAALIAAGANVMHKTNRGDSVLLQAVYGKKSKHLECAKIIVQKAPQLLNVRTPATPNGKHDSETPVEWCTRKKVPTTWVGA